MRPRKTILCVEDNEQILSVRKFMLETRGYRVIAVTTGQAALELLTVVRVRDAYANLALPAILRRYGLHDRDAAFATELGYGTLRAIGLLDAVIEECTDRPLAKVEHALLDALRLGAYQLLRTRIPPHAAVDSAVELIRHAEGSKSAGFVNAILRNCQAR